MPLTTPCRSPLRSSSTPSSPLPKALVRIARAGAAHRGEQVGEDQRALQEVELAVELDAGGGEEVPAEAGHRHVVVPEHALVGQVVDGEDGGEAAQERMVAVEQ